MYFEDIEIGTEMIIPETYVDRDEMIAFARKYNNAPFHADEKWAKSTALGDVSAPGIYTFLLIWSQYVINDLGGEQTIAGTDMKLSFLAPVMPGDTLKGIVRVISKTERNPYNGLVVIQIDIYNQNEFLVLRNTTSTVIKRRC